MQSFIFILIGAASITGSMMHYLSKDYDPDKYASNRAFRGMLLGIACITWGIILIVKK